jgi:hypothetical protein
MIVVGALLVPVLILIILYEYQLYKERRRGYNGGSTEQQSGQSSGNTGEQLATPNINAIVKNVARELLNNVHPENTIDVAVLNAAEQVVDPKAEKYIDISPDDAKSLKRINQAIFGLQTLTYLMYPYQKKKLLRVALKKFIKDCPTIDVEEIYYKILFETDTSDKTSNVLSKLDNADDLLINCNKEDITDVLRSMEEQLGMNNSPDTLLRKLKVKLDVKDRLPGLFSRYLTAISRRFSSYPSLRTSFKAMSAETYRKIFRNKSNPIIKKATAQAIDDVVGSLSEGN